MSDRNIPTDLIPLPTAPYDMRPISMPLDVEECRTALWRCEGNVTKAAELMKVPSLRLRNFIKNSPRLSAEAKEARDQLVDIAETVVYDALTDEKDPGRRDNMARFVLNGVGRDRGYSAAANGGGKVNVNINGGDLVISWADGQGFDGGQNDPMTIEGELVNDE